MTYSRPNNCTISFCSVSPAEGGCVPLSRLWVSGGFWCCWTLVPSAAVVSACEWPHKLPWWMFVHAAHSTDLVLSACKTAWWGTATTTTTRKKHKRKNKASMQNIFWATLCDVKNAGVAEWIHAEQKWLTRLSINIYLSVDVSCYCSSCLNKFLAKRHRWRRRCLQTALLLNSFKLEEQNASLFGV